MIQLLSGVRMFTKSLLLNSDIIFYVPLGAEIKMPDGRLPTKSCIGLDI